MATTFPIGIQSMQNTTFLALLRPIFALKAKIAPSPPHWFWQKESVYLNLVLKKIRLQISFPAWVKTFFPFFFVFWSSPNFDHKTVPILNEDFFFFFTKIRTQNCSNSERKSFCFGCTLSKQLPLTHFCCKFPATRVLVLCVIVD